MKKINFTKEKGLVPAIIQDVTSQEVLMLGFMNSQALNKTVQEGYVYFWSRSRNTLWKKGETSGNCLKVKTIITDCDNDAIIVKVEVIGDAVCHLGKKSCFTKKYL